MNKEIALHNRFQPLQIEEAEYTSNCRSSSEEKKTEKTQKKKKKKKQKNINLLYANPNGVLGKVSSIITATKSLDSHIIALAETKLGRTPQIYQDTRGKTTQEN